MDDINSKISINSDTKKNTAYGKVELIPSSNLFATVTVSNNNNLNAIVHVSPKNKMFGTVQVEERVIKTVKINTVQDTFVRSLYPTLNYGEQKDLLIGYNGTEIFRTLINFDLESIPQTAVFISAKLKLYPLDYVISDTKIELYEAQDRWYEYGVTYNSQPRLGIKLGEYLDIENEEEDNEIEEYTEFDITNIMSDWVKVLRCQNGIVIKSIDETEIAEKRYSSREGGFSPYLELMYYDDSKISYGYSKLPAKVNVSNNNNKDIFAQVKIPKYESGAEIPAQVISRNGSLLNSLISVTKDELFAKVNIPANNDLLSVVKVSNNRINEIHGVIGITHDSIKAVVKVTAFKDLPSKVQVRQTINNDINGRLSISKPFLNGIVKIWGYNNFYGTVKVERSDANDLNGIVINKRTENNTINSKVLVTYFNDLSAQVKIIGQGNSCLNGKVIVKNNVEKNLNAKVNVSIFCDLIAQVKVNGSTDISAKVNCRRTNEEDFPSIVEVTYFENLRSTISVSNPNVNGQIVVRNISESNLIGRVNISPSKDLQAKVLVTKYNDLQAKVNIMIPFANDFQALVETKDPSVIKGKVSIRETDDYYISSNISVSRPCLNSQVTISKSFMQGRVNINQPNISGTVLVNIPFIKGNVSITKPDINGAVFVSKGILQGIVSVFKSSIDGKVIVSNPFIQGSVLVRELATQDFSARVNILYNNNEDLEATVNVRLSNKMFGKIEIDSPPIINYSNIDVQDSFIRKSVPVLNYGHAEDMYIGSGDNSDEIFRSLINFNISDLPKTAYITSAKIVLTSYDDNLFPTNIQLYEVTKAWNEYGVTYNSQPPLGKLLVTVPSTNTSQSEINFDITSIIDDYWNGLIAQEGFLIKSSDENIDAEKRFYTREGKCPPRIEIEYFDTSVTSLGSSTINSQVIVRQNKASDILGQVKIPSYDYSSDLNGKVLIRNGSYIFGKVNVSKGDIKSRVIVRNNQENNLGAKVAVSNYNESSLNASVIINQPDLLSQIIVRRYDKKDINGMVTIRNNKNDDLNSIIRVQRTNISDFRGNVNVSIPNINAIVKVCQISDLTAQVTITQNVNLDLKAKISVVYKSDFNGSVKVTPINDLKAVVSIQNYSNKDINARITIPKNEFINAIVNVYNHNDIKGKVIIPTNKDINAKVNVCQINDLQAKIKVVNGSIDSKVVVRRNETFNINSQVNVLPTNNLFSKVIITKAKDINAKVAVKLPYYNDFQGTVIVKNEGINNVDIYGFVKVKVNNVVIGYVFIM